MATEKQLDLVEREAVKDAIGFMNLHFLGHGENKNVLDSINEVPSVDAVEVVRCKDCRHYVLDEFDGCYICLHICKYVKPNFGCVDGERKDNERKAD